MFTPESFDLTDPFTILRIVCGAFFIPHMIGKFTNPAALEFFTAAGFKPPKVWLYIGFIIDGFLAAGLILGIYSTIAAAGAAAYLAVAAIAVFRVSKGTWLWHVGGCEYPAFWAICCAVVALGT